MKTNKLGKSNAQGIAFLFLPYIACVVAVVLLALSAFSFITSSGIVQIAFNRLPNKQAGPEILQTDVIKPIGDVKDFPKIGYLEQWATVNVEGWKEKDIPVFLGDTNESLRVGVGMPTHSQFCGRGGRVVMDAHVTTFFNEIEKTEVGRLVNVSTVYGNYVYKVEKIQIFDGNDNRYIYPNTEKEELVMYTCYPYNNQWRPRTQRIALICSIVEGKVWR